MPGRRGEHRWVSKSTRVSSYKQLKQSLRPPSHQGAT